MNETAIRTEAGGNRMASSGNAAPAVNAIADDRGGTQGFADLVLIDAQFDCQMGPQCVLF